MAEASDPALPPPEKKPGFFATVIAQIFDLRPAAITASLLQFAIVFGIGKLLVAYCPLVPASYRTYCSKPWFDAAAGMFPSIVFWLLVIVLAIVLIYLFVVIRFGLPVILMLGFGLAGGYFSPAVGGVAALFGLVLGIVLIVLLAGPHAVGGGGGGYRANIRHY